MKKLAVFFVLFFFMFGCVPTRQPAAGEEPLQIKTIETGSYGAGSDTKASATWITTAEQLKSVLSLIDRQMLPQQPRDFPRIDFANHWILMIDMGQQPTGGYSLSLNQADGRISDNNAFVSVTWNVPPEGAILTQVLTRPYLLLELAKGSYSSVSVTDQAGRKLFEIETPE